MYDRDEHDLKTLEQMKASQKAGYLAYCTVALDGGISLGFHTRQSWGDRQWNRTSVSGIGSTAYPYGRAYVDRIIAAGLLVIDCSTATDTKALLLEVMTGPMLAQAPADLTDQIFPPESALGYVTLERFAERRAAVGVTFHNLPR